jgi:hypothetical protein
LEALGVPTKEQIADALRKHERVELAAESLGLGKRRMYRFMARYGLTLKSVLNWPSLPESGGNDEPEPAEAETATPTVEKDARRLTAADFSGACMGESTRQDSRSGSADELLARYHRRKYY